MKLSRLWMIAVALAGFSCKPSEPQSLGLAPKAPTTTSASHWTPLFNGKDLSGFHTFIKTPGLDKDAEGYFKVEEVDGAPAVHVMDLPVVPDKRDFGYFITDGEYANFELRFECKWGVKKHAPRTKAKRDAGCLYFMNGPDKVWPDSVECQVEEGDTGDLWIVGKNIEVGTTVHSLTGNARGEMTYAPGGIPVRISQRLQYKDASGALKNVNGRVIQGGTADGLSGWNTVQIFARGNNSVHIVNGRVVNHLTDMKFIDSALPLEKGRILFQAEGSEVFYRKMEIRPLAADETIPATQNEYDSRWQVNDRLRPRPGQIAPQVEADLAESAKAPPNAVVLFDGTDLSAWEDSKWKVEDGTVEIVAPKRAPSTSPTRKEPALLTSELTPDALASKGNLISKQSFGSCKVHLEFACPNPPRGKDQAQANSGVFMMCKYEMQVLDNTNNPTYADGLAGAVYGENPPLWDSSRPSGEWNYYDIEWQCPVFAPGGTVVKRARVSAWLNGIKVQDDFELTGPTEHQRRLPYVAHADKLPLMLQNHGQIVKFRNIWVLPED